MVRVPIKVVWDEPSMCNHKVEVVKKLKVSEADAKKTWEELTKTKQDAIKKDYDDCKDATAEVVGP